MSDDTTIFVGQMTAFSCGQESVQFVNRREGEDKNTKKNSMKIVSSFPNLQDFLPAAPPPPKKKKLHPPHIWKPTHMI